MFALPPGCQQPKTIWFLKKHGSRKILAGSQNPEAFVMGLEVSFLGQDFASHGLSLEFETILYPLYPLSADKHKSIQLPNYMKS